MPIALPNPTYAQVLSILATLATDLNRKGKPKLTHVAIKVGNGLATNQDESYIAIRESKNYWIDKNNTKYHKDNGREVSEWAKTHIKLDSITTASHSPTEQINPLYR